MRFILIVLLSLSLFGRDNPFFPADPNKIETQSTNKIENPKPFTTQNIALPNSARVIKEIVIKYQNFDGSLSEEALPLNSSIDWHEPLIVSHAMEKKTESAKKSEVYSAKFITFSIDEKVMKVETSDPLLRNFMLTNPRRIVMDFSRDDSFKPKMFSVHTKPYSKIRMGNHDKYYRVVIELDGKYAYSINTDANAHIITLK